MPTNIFYLFRIKNEFDQKIFLSFFILSFNAMPICFYLMRLKIKKIRDPEMNNTYCVFSIIMLYIMQFVYVYLWFTNFILACLLFCDNNFLYENQVIIWEIYGAVTFITIVMAKNNLYLQALEWIAMIYIINTQKSQTLG